VLAVGIALNSSISTAYWSGGACYAIALLALIWGGQRSLATVRAKATPGDDMRHGPAVGRPLPSGEAR